MSGLTGSTEAAPAGEVALRPLGAGDLAGALGLSREAGWNQVEADWRLFLDLGAGYGLFAPDGALVGTACTLPYPPRAGWVSMVIVDDAWRRRGLGGRLLGVAIEALRATDLTPLLDATPLGRPLYLRLGFHDLWTFHRYVAEAPAPRGAGSEGGDVRPLAEGDWEAVIALDEAALGVRREALLRRQAARLPAAAWVAEGSGGLAGVLLGREGRTAAHLGPLVAGDPGVAAALLDAALARVPGPVQIDVLDTQQALQTHLEGLGFTSRRAFTRMALGEGDPLGLRPTLYAVAGPELG